jgi:hypothetical protein
VNHLLESVKCLIGDYKPIIAKGIYEDDKWTHYRFFQNAKINQGEIIWKFQKQ